MTTINDINFYYDYNNDEYLKSKSNSEEESYVGLKCTKEQLEHIKDYYNKIVTNDDFDRYILAKGTLSIALFKRISEDTSIRNAEINSLGKLFNLCCANKYDINIQNYDNENYIIIKYNIIKGLLSELRYGSDQIKKNCIIEIFKTLIPEIKNNKTLLKLQEVLKNHEKEYALFIGEILTNIQAQRFDDHKNLTIFSYLDYKYIFLNIDNKNKKYIYIPLFYGYIDNKDNIIGDYIDNYIREIACCYNKRDISQYMKDKGYLNLSICFDKIYDKFIKDYINVFNTYKKSITNIKYFCENSERKYTLIPNKINKESIINNLNDDSEYINIFKNIPNICEIAKNNEIKTINICYEKHIKSNNIKCSKSTLNIILLDSIEDINNTKNIFNSYNALYNTSNEKTLDYSFADLKLTCSNSKNLRTFDEESINYLHNCINNIYNSHQEYKGGYIYINMPETLYTLLNLNMIPIFDSNVNNSNNIIGLFNLNTNSLLIRKSLFELTNLQYKTIELCNKFIADLYDNDFNSGCISPVFDYVLNELNNKQYINKKFLLNNKITIDYINKIKDKLILNNIENNKNVNICGTIDKNEVVKILCEKSINNNNTDKKFIANKFLNNFEYKNLLNKKQSLIKQLQLIDYSINNLSNKDNDNVINETIKSNVDKYILLANYIKTNKYITDIYIKNNILYVVFNIHEIKNNLNDIKYAIHPLRWKIRLDNDGYSPLIGSYPEVDSVIIKNTSISFRDVLNKICKLDNINESIINDYVNIIINYIKTSKLYLPDCDKSEQKIYLNNSNFEPNSSYTIDDYGICSRKSIPHAGYDKGRSCFGNAEPMLNDAYGNNNICYILDILHEYSQSVNPKDTWGKSIYTDYNIVPESESIYSFLLKKYDELNSNLVSYGIKRNFLEGMKVFMNINPVILNSMIPITNLINLIGIKCIENRNINMLFNCLCRKYFRNFTIAERNSFKKLMDNLNIKIEKSDESILVPFIKNGITHYIFDGNNCIQQSTLKKFEVNQIFNISKFLKCITSKWQLTIDNPENTSDYYHLYSLTTFKIKLSDDVYGLLSLMGNNYCNNCYDITKTFNIIVNKDDEKSHNDVIEKFKTDFIECLDNY